MGLIFARTATPWSPELSRIIGIAISAEEEDAGHASSSRRSDHGAEVTGRFDRLNRQAQGVGFDLLDRR